MSDLFDHPVSQAILLLAAIFLITALGLAVVRKFRGSEVQDRPSRSEMMSKFRDLHSQGGLSDEEFRTIKTKLASELQAELNDNNHND